MKKYEIVEKDWGTVEVLFFNNITRVSKISVNKGGKSSYGKYHKHQRMYNQFVVFSGTLILYVETYERTHKILLGPDEEDYTYTILPGIWHRFEAETDVEGIEIYFNFIDPDKDIVRKTES